MDNFLQVGKVDFISSSLSSKYFYILLQILYKNISIYVQKSPLVYKDIKSKM